MTYGIYSALGAAVADGTAEACVRVAPALRGPVIAVDEGATQNKHKGSEFVSHHLYCPQLSVTRHVRLCLRAKIPIWNLQTSSFIRLLI